MKRYKQNPDFLHIGETLIQWYKNNARELPWRASQSPYHIWISEIILQQTQVAQGLPYYQRFIKRFPTVNDLAEAPQDEVLLYWKGLGYYSRAINLQKAAQQVVNDYKNEFPDTSKGLETLKGVGKYTSAAIASICFGEVIPAVDGNFYRVLSRFFGDSFDISSSKSFVYFTELAYRIMPNHSPGEFNQAIMDLGANICTPKLAKCEDCPLQKDCVAYSVGDVYSFPVKIKKTKVEAQDLHYTLIRFEDYFLIQKRDNTSIWKNLYEIIPSELISSKNLNSQEISVVKHKLSHRDLSIYFNEILLNSIEELRKLAAEEGWNVVQYKQISEFSFPKPIDTFLQKQAKHFI